MSEIFQKQKQNIRENRQKIRSSLLNLCKTKISADINSQPEILTASEAFRQRKRKTSENLKNFQTLSVFRDQSVKQNFESLFEVQTKIGQGCQSTVHKCKQISSGNIYAVKIIKQKDLQAVQNSRNCYEILQYLDHECIPKGKYLFINQRLLTVHMVSEYVAYSQLRNFIKLNKSINEKIVANIIRQLLDCLAYMSLKGVVHRDIKPQNILYNQKTGKLKIIDFQIAKMQRYSHQKLQLWSNTGTLQYRAPETFRGAYGIPVDIWAVGIIAYELITGTVPFKSSYKATLINKICCSDIDFNHPNMTPTSRFFIQKLLAKDPKQRITPKQALSHPFILKNYEFKPSPPTKVIASFSQKQQLETASSQDIASPTQQHRFYGEDNHFRLANGLAKDLGIRICEV